MLLETEHSLGSKEQLPACRSLAWDGCGAAGRVLVALQASALRDRRGGGRGEETVNC